MKICLVSPLTVSEFDERRVTDSEARRLVAGRAPVGILSLAAVLESCGTSPYVIDLNDLRYSYIKSGGDRRDGMEFSSYVVSRLSPLACELYGFGTICSSYPLTIRLARNLRRARPDTRIVLGGPQASVVDTQTLRAFPFIDFIVRGEAEATLPLLLDALASDSPNLARIGGLTYRMNGEVMRNSNATVIEDLDALPLPAYHLFPQIEASKYFPLEAGRGCPFACSFCSTNDFFRRRFRLKSPQVLVRQMLQIKKTYGISSFDLIHDMFTVDRRKVEGFCETIIESGARFRWSCSARTDCVDDELISLMEKAGCRGVFFGIDSGSEAVQKAINKRLDIPEAASRLRVTNKHNIHTTVSLITGFPEEAADDLRATVKFLGASLRFPKAHPQLHLLAPLAATPITTQYRDELIYDAIYSDISFCGSELSAEDREMIVEHRDIFPNFYAVPTRWLDRHYLKELRSFLLQGASKQRWLMTFFHRDAGDLVRVFDQWKRWRSGQENADVKGTSDRDYYSTAAFSSDLLRFARSHYATTATQHPHLLTTLVDVAEVLHSSNEDSPSLIPSEVMRQPTKHPPLKAEAVVSVTSTATVVHVNADYKKLLRRLKRGERFDTLTESRTALVLMKKANGIKIIQLSSTADKLLQLCDGTRSAEEVVRNFSLTEKIEGVTMLKAGVYGLSWLNNLGLIEAKLRAPATIQQCSFGVVHAQVSPS